MLTFFILIFLQKNYLQRIYRICGLCNFPYTGMFRYRYRIVIVRFRYDDKDMPDMCELKQSNFI